MRTPHFAALGLLAIAAIANAAPPKKRAAAPKSEPAACAALHSDYEEASKRLAMNEATGIGDRSAIRATMRETENNGILAKARMTLDLLKGNGCRSPTSAPSMSRYFGSALKCQNDLMGVRLSGTYSFPPSCERAKWTPDVQPGN